MCGTPSYLAPEVVQKNVNGYGHGVDSWSVGVIVFSMWVPVKHKVLPFLIFALRLTLQSPFIENEDADLRVRIETRTTDWTMLHRCGVSDIGVCGSDGRIKMPRCLRAFPSQGLHPPVVRNPTRDSNVCPRVSRTPVASRCRGRPC